MLIKGFAEVINEKQSRSRAWQHRSVIWTEHTSFHAANSFHKQSQQQPADQGHDNSFAPEEKLGVEPSKLLEQTLTTDALLKWLSQTAVVSSIESGPRSSTDYSSFTSLAPTSMPSDALVPANQQLESPLAERALDTMNFDTVKGRPIRIMWSQRDPSLRKSGVKIATDEESSSKGYGFVHFETEEAANNAIMKVNGMLLNGRKVGKAHLDQLSYKQSHLLDYFVIYCNKFTTRLLQIQRSSISMSPFRLRFVGKFIPRKEHEQLLGEKARQFMNVYIKNLGDNIDDKLRELFDNYGKITSAKVMTDCNGYSKGFGFVCVSSPEEATKAVTEMNGRIVISKPLYVAVAQLKEDHKAHLASQYMQRMAGMHMQIFIKEYNPIVQS